VLYQINTRQFTPEGTFKAAAWSESIPDAAPRLIWTFSPTG